MNDHNLDDLIIDNIEPQNGKAKSILTIIALLIIVLIVAIILTKVILKDPNSEQILVDDTTEMISPELTLQNVSKKKVSQEETKLSSIIEKELNKPVKAPETPVVPEVKEPTETINPVQTEEAKEVVTEVPTPEVKAVKKTVTKTEAASVPITKEFEQSPTVEKTKPAPAPVKEKKVERVTSLSGQTFYIQVGSFTQTPSSRFLGVIKNSGFHYKIVTSGKTKKLLIGPYKNRSSADTALVRVKDRINKSAFVVKK